MSDDITTAIGVALDGTRLRAAVTEGGETSATITSYAQTEIVDPDDHQAVADVIERTVSALQAPDDAVLSVACTHRPDDVDDLRAAINQTSLADRGEVNIESVADARARALHPDRVNELYDCTIPPGLLEAHDGLTTAGLAVPVGAALGALNLGADSPTRIADRAMTIWVNPSDDDGTLGESDVASSAPPSMTERDGLATETVTHRRGFAMPAWVGALLGVALLVALGVILSQCLGDDDGATVATAEPVDTADETDAPSDAAADQPEPDEGNPAGDIVDEDAVALASDDAASDDAAGGDDVESAEAPTTEPEPTEAPAPTATAVPEPTATPEPEPTTDPLAGLPPLSTLPERGATYRPPILFLEGPVQTQEQADALYERAVAVVGEDNVVNNYIVRPDAPPAIDGNVRVEQAVLFETGSAVIAPDFIPTLELGVAVMTLNPQVVMIVEGHTDSVGGDDQNLALSRERAQAAVDYMVSRGVDEERFEAVGFGESRPIAPNDTDEGRQLNRRIEVDLLDLLAPDNG